ncbi:MAG: protein adenylyltransferase SelO [Cytophagaceae bacterium]
MGEHLHQKIYNKDFVSFFKGDHTGNLTSRQTPGFLYSKAVPTPVSQPTLLAWSQALADQLGIAYPDEKDVAILAGNLITETMVPYAACYAGHQFGNWAGQLGDGRAITLGEWNTGKGSFELQLKGAGPTPYSRRSDGRAVLRSSLREFLMSEAMHYLGVPTTRALSLVSTGDQVVRDMFYNGNAAYEPGAIVMRVAPSFLRFGNFEMLASRQETENLKMLVEWTINKFFPQIPEENIYLNWFAEVVELTAHLMTEWQRVGFVHGVMNTDNMSVFGLTIDYGPYSFLDHYDLNFTPNTTDLPGRRYAFGKQPSIAYWNLSCLANAIAPLFPETDPLVKVLESYVDLYWNKYYRMMSNKLGLDNLREEDVDLIIQLEKVLVSIHPDMTIFYRLLCEIPEGIPDRETIIRYFNKSFYSDISDELSESLFNWLQLYYKRLETNSISREKSRELMRRNNPHFVLRNYLLHQAIEEMESGIDTLFLKLQEAIKDPYSDKFPEFFAKRPDWATQKAGCSMLSCSS